MYYYIQVTVYAYAGEIFGSLCDFDFEISILSLSILIGFPLDKISKCVNILSKPNEPKVNVPLACLFKLLDTFSHREALK